MDSTEFAQGVVRGNGNVMAVSHGGDESLIVVFYNESVKQGHASEKAGRPIFQDVPYVWIRFPGDRTREVKKKANDEYKQRFPRQWAAFERQEQVVEVGTPLEQWGPISKSSALNYKGMNIHTVENLAAVSDTTLHNLGHGGRDMRDKAIAWLKSSGDSAEAMRLATENQALKDDVAMLKAQMAELASKKRSKD